MKKLRICGSTGVHSCPAGQDPHSAVHVPFAHTANAGQSLFELHGAPQKPARSPGNAMQTWGEVHSAPVPSQVVFGALELSLPDSFVSVESLFPWPDVDRPDPVVERVPLPDSEQPNSHESLSVPLPVSLADSFELWFPEPLELRLVDPFDVLPALLSVAVLCVPSEPEVDERASVPASPGPPVLVPSPVDVVPVEVSPDPVVVVPKAVVPVVTPLGPVVVVARPDDSRVRVTPVVVELAVPSVPEVEVRLPSIVAPPSGPPGLSTPTPPPQPAVIPTPSAPRMPMRQVTYLPRACFMAYPFEEMLERMELRTSGLARPSP